MDMKTLVVGVMLLASPALLNGKACNYRIDTLMGHPFVSAMGCDPQNSIFYQCNNASTVLMKQFSNHSCSGTPTAEGIVPAASIGANCSEMLDCHVTELDYPVSTTCNGTHPQPITQYTGDLCQPSLDLFGANRSVRTTCDAYHFVRMEFEDKACDWSTLTHVQKYELNSCLMPMNGTTIQKSMMFSCVNPQHTVVPTNIPNNPMIWEETTFGDDGCKTRMVSQLQSYNASRKCVADLVFNLSRDLSCDTQYDWVNHFEGTNCDYNQLVFRTGSHANTCDQGKRVQCITPFGPSFTANQLKIENFLDPGCQLMVMDVSAVDEYRLGVCIGIVKYSCSSNGGEAIDMVDCGNTTTPVTYPLDKCVENPDASQRGSVPYVRVTSTAGCGIGPLVPTNSEPKKADAAPIAIGVTLGVIILLGVGCIYYRREKLKREEETLQLLTNETEK